MNTSRRASWLILLWIVWAGVVSSVYYRQALGVFSQGLLNWLPVQFSLESVIFTLRSIGAGLPAGWEALLRLLNGLWGAALVVLGAQVLGAVIFKAIRWQPPDRIEQLLYRTALGFGGLAYLSLALAGLGVYRPLSLKILIGSILLAGGLAIVIRRAGLPLFSRRQESPAETGIAAGSPGSLQIAPRGLSPDASARRTPRQTPRQTGVRLWIAISILAISIALIGALAPEKEYDALWYHLNLPRLWLAQGSPVDQVSEYISLYPLTWEMNYGLGLALSGQVAAKLLHFSCLILCSLLVFRWIRWRHPSTSPWLGVALFVTIPTVLWEATTAYNDLALALFTGLVFFALLHYLEKRDWHWLVMATVSLGLALATKHLAIFVMAIAVTWLAAALWLRDRDWRSAFGPALLMGLASLLIPLPWYLRSWAASGNPVFPDLYGLFGASPLERWSEVTEAGLQHFKDHFGDGRSLASLTLLPWNLTLHAARYGGTIGPIFLAALPLILFLPGSRIVRWMVVWVGLYLALWASPLSSFQLRFLIPITPLLAVLAAQAFQEAGRRLPRPGLRIIAIYGLAGLLLLNLPPFTSLQEGDRIGDSGWLTHVIHEVPLGVVLGAVSQEQYLARSVPSYRAWQYIDSQTQAGSTILSFSGGDYFYSERSRIWSDATIARPAVWGASKENALQAIASLRGLDVDYVLLDAAMLDSPSPDAPAIVDPSVLDRWFSLEYQDERYRLYRLLDEDAAAEHLP